jgi:hypothetical protein
MAHLWKLDGEKYILQLMKADLMDEGSLDKVMRGCHGVFHTTSHVVVVKSYSKESFYFF